MGISMSKSVSLVVFLVFILEAFVVATKPVSGDDLGAWTTKAMLREARSGLGVAVVNGRIYAIGGTTSSGFVASSPGSAVYAGKTPTSVTSLNEEYDPATDTWTTKTAMPT